VEEFVAEFRLVFEVGCYREVGDEDGGVIVEGAALDVVDVLGLVAVVVDGGVRVGGVGAAASAAFDRFAVIVFKELPVVDVVDLALELDRRLKTASGVPHTGDAADDERAAVVDEVQECRVSVRVGIADLPDVAVPLQGVAELGALVGVAIDAGGGEVVVAGRFWVATTGGRYA